MPRVVALLNFYEESPTWLASLVASLRGLAEHLVCVEGAYLLYPDGHRNPRSGAEQFDALHTTAQATGVGLTVHSPAEAWAGNEVEKRDFMFAAGRLVGADWFLVIDGDELVTSVPGDFSERLEETDMDVAEISLWQRNTENERDDQTPEHMDIPSQRRLLRNIPNLRVSEAHYVYEADGRYLWGNPGMHVLEPALDLNDLRVEHRHDQRRKTRKWAALSYYQKRDQLGVERITETSFA